MLSGDNEDDTNVLAFAASNSVVDPLTTTSDDQEIIIVDEKDEQDELIDSYNALMLKHIKSKKDTRKVIKSLDENNSRRK